MKATGIVRRIDELGRIVIPKEIRRTFKIKEGTPLEIFCGDNNELILKKHSMIFELRDIASEICLATYNTLRLPVFVCDKDNIIAISGASKSCYEQKEISEKLRRYIDLRKDILKNKTDGDIMIEFFDGDQPDYYSQVVVPILASGDTYGALVCFSKSQIKLSNLEIQVLKAMANFLSEQIV